MRKSMMRGEGERPVPAAWRGTFRQIASAFAAGDYQLRHHPIEGVASIDASTAKMIAGNVEGYGDQLVALNDKTWDSSICRWIDDHWIALVDLSTLQEVISDLVLFARVYDEPVLRVEVNSVHVP